MSPATARLPLVRPFMLIVLLVLTIGSVGLFFLPAVTVGHWPWVLAPFNARFLGAVYLAEFVAVLTLLVHDCWAPARVALPMAACFTFFVTLASLRHPERWDFARPVVAAWFVVYVGSCLVSVLLLWHYRRPAENAVPTPRGWRRLLQVQALALAGYGAGLLLAPQRAAAFWPWPIDAFHASLYAAVFLTGALGSLLLTRVAARIEWLTLGLSQCALGLFAVLGLLLVDARLHRVDWQRPGGWLWVGLFVLLALLGLALLSRAASRDP